MSENALAEEAKVELDLSKAQDEMSNVLSQVKSATEQFSSVMPELQKELETVKGELSANQEVSAETKAKLEEISGKAAETSTTVDQLKAHSEELAKKLDRPGFGTKAYKEEEFKKAVEWKTLVHNAKNKSSEIKLDESTVDVEEYRLAKSAMDKFMRTPYATNRADYLTPEEMKSLSSFAFEGNNFILQPEFSDEVIRCEDEKQDVTQFFRTVTISKQSIVYPINNDLDLRAAWACEHDCFANNPSANLAEGWGQLEMKPEKLRYVVCADRDFLDDAEIDMEAWLREEIGRAFRETECDAFIGGDGVGKPTGFLHPNAGIPKVDTSANTPAGELTWQDVLALPYQIDRQNFTNESAYFMNQRTWAKIMTMSDANGKPIWMVNPSQRFPLTIGGFPVVVMDAMPDIAVGACPIAFGNWSDVYRIVRRRALEMQRDDYSGGFCPIFKFESRVTGGVFCPNKARLLAIK